MSWLPPADASLPPYEAWLAHRPELQALYKRFYGALWDEQLLPPRLLELCRLRVAMMHECDAELAVTDPAAGVSEDDREALGHWWRDDRFTPAERAALVIADKMPYSHHDITDDEYAAVREHLGEPGTVALTVALALFDANCRLRLTFEVPASPEPSAAPSAAGPLH
jgi:alkylhydroperoxidase family enzyme